MMLGWLLARAGVRVTVLEKHADFLRDFRGDTIHPSTLELMHELGVLEEFLKRPHQEIQKVHAHIGDTVITLGDFTTLRTACRFMCLMPQWDFLDFVAQQAARYPSFHVRMRGEVTELIQEGEGGDGRVCGVRAQTPEGPLEVRAEVVIGCDGRGSTVRAASGLPMQHLGAPMDVLWMRLSKRPTDRELFFRSDYGKVLVTLDRGDYWQAGLSIPKGTAEDVRKRGIGELHKAIVQLAPHLTDRMSEIPDWDHVRLLTVRVERLLKWHKPGLLCIGDAAHAMSPVGGVGINLAIQDAVAAANILAGPLREGTCTEQHLAQVQQRRAFPTRFTQGFQVIMQRQMGGRGFGEDRPVRLPLPVRLLEKTPLPRRIRARLVGVGVRPEHVRTPAVES